MPAAAESGLLEHGLADVRIMAPDTAEPPPVRPALAARGVTPEAGQGASSSRRGCGSAPGDKYEREADRVARRVMRRLDAGSPSGPGEGDTPRAPQPAGDREDNMIMRVSPGALEAGMIAPPGVSAAIGQASQGGQPLPDPLRAEFEQAMGADFSRVKVHAERDADKLSRSVRAQAFTTDRTLPTQSSNSAGRVFRPYQVCLLPAAPLRRPTLQPVLRSRLMKARPRRLTTRQARQQRPS